MKKVYWRPRKVCSKQLLAVAVIACCGWSVIRAVPVRATADERTQRQQAVARAAQAFRCLRSAADARAVPIDLAFDPSGSSLVGRPHSLITSRPGDLHAKQATVNPAFAAVTARLLQEAGVRPGDVVAIGWTGSLPALNLAVASTIEAMHLQPLAVASAASSQYGANRPDWTWLDMEGALSAAGLINFRSLAVTYGAGADQGWGLEPLGKAAIDAVAQREGISQWHVSSRQEAIERRMELYARRAQRRPIAAYINVGGGVASTGGRAAGQDFLPGLNRPATTQFGAMLSPTSTVDSVMTRFRRQGVPVIDLRNVEALASKYGLPMTATATPVADVKSIGRAAAQPRRELAFLVLVVVLVAMHVVVHRPDWLRWPTSQATIVAVRYPNGDVRTDTTHHRDMQLMV